MTTATETALDRARLRVQEMIDSRERSQLETYCKDATMDVLTDDEIREHAPGYSEYLLNDVGRRSLENTGIGYDIASRLETSRLREIFEEDSYGPAWEVKDSEDLEYYEQDEGAIQVLSDVLIVLNEEANNA